MKNTKKILTVVFISTVFFFYIKRKFYTDDLGIQELANAIVTLGFIVGGIAFVALLSYYLLGGENE